MDGTQHRKIGWFSGAPIQMAIVQLSQHTIGFSSTPNLSSSHNQSWLIFTCIRIHVKKITSLKALTFFVLLLINPGKCFLVGNTNVGEQPMG